MTLSDSGALERLLFNRKFLPYAYGSPRRSLTYDDQYPRANLLFFSDSHVDFHLADQSLENVREVFDYAENAPVPLDAMIHAGDIITPFGIVPKSEVLARAESFFSIARESHTPLLFSKGNHDLGDWDNLPENMLTDSDWGRLFLDHAEERFGIVRQRKASGEKSTWHYLDLPKHRIRIIALDAHDTDKSRVGEDGRVLHHGGRSVYLSNEQLNWLASEALCFDSKEDPDWGVIAVLHNTECSRPMPHENAAERMLDLLAAFGAAESYRTEYRHPSNPFFDIDLSADFTKYKDAERRPHMICVLLGHLHVDQYRERKGLHLIWTLNNSASIDYGDARVVRIPGTSTQNCFDILNIDTRARRIRILRYGAGQNCHGEGGDRFLPDGLPY